MFKGYRFIRFDFTQDAILVAYKSDKNLNDEIEDAIYSFYYQIGDDEDIEYEEAVKDIMDSFNIEWEIVNHTNIEME